MDLITKINIEEKEGIERFSEPVSIGVPLKMGLFETLGVFQIEMDDQRSPADAEILARWPDGSIRWLLVTFDLDLAADQTCELSLFRQDSRSGLEKSDRFQNHALEYYDEADSVRMVSSLVGVRVSKRLASEPSNSERLPVFLEFKGHDQAAQLSLECRDHQATPYTFALKRDPLVNVCRGTTRVTLDGELRSHTTEKPKKNDLNLRLVLDVVPGHPFVRVAMTLHNPSPSRHQGGFWELGDEGAVLLQSLSVSLNQIPKGKMYARFEAGAALCSMDGHQTLELYQESSGLENWQSRSHLNRENKVPLTFKGYRVLMDGTTGAEGLCANPMIALDHGDFGVCMIPRKFWQNFPKGLKLTQESLEYQIFPKRFPDSHEIQGGESKSHEFLIGVGTTDAGVMERMYAFIEHPLHASLPFETYQAANALPFRAPASVQDFDLGLQNLIDYGLEGERNFFQKREAIDEFGWRNFGDVFADHEGLYHKGETPLISHYNNQYDMIYGFWGQFFRSGRFEWAELATDLSQHLVDIDIYHTEEDRPQYNHGLFWHTDHYLDAQTSSHRTFNRLHMKEDHVEQSGGGPGSEHCYSLGLAYTYLVTGEVQYQNEVLGLHRWMTSIMGVPDTIFGCLLTFAKKDMKKLVQSLKGKQADRFIHPLTRATGNYVNSALDCWLVSSDTSYLSKAFDIIFHTAHPEEDVSARGLDNIEDTWSYLVFLQSVCRYLLVKETVSQLDQDYEYSLALLINYARWMMEHEYIYLDKPELLVYPNFTWTAQEVRKVYLLNFAASYVGHDDANRMVEKAKRIRDRIVQDASNTEEATYSRFIALLMQTPVYTPSPSTKQYEFSAHDFGPVQTSALKIVGAFCRLILSRLRRLNLRAEVSWLKSRLRSNG